MSDPRNLDCLSVLHEVWDYLDRELSPEEMDQMRRHLERCAKCEKYARYQQAFLAALASAREGRCAPPALKARVFAALQEAGFGRGGRDCGEMERPARGD